MPAGSGSCFCFFLEGGVEVQCRIALQPLAIHPPTCGRCRAVWCVPGLPPLPARRRNCFSLCCSALLCSRRMMEFARHSVDIGTTDVLRVLQVSLCMGCWAVSRLFRVA